MASYWDVYVAIQTSKEPLPPDDVARMLGTDTAATRVALDVLSGAELVYAKSDGSVIVYALGGRARTDREARALAAAWCLDLTTPIGEHLPPIR